MKNFDATTLDRLENGEVDYLDTALFVFDSGVVGMWIGGRGQFTYNDPDIGEHTWYGGGSLLEMEIPGNSLAGESAQVVLRLNETYMVEGSDEPVSIWDDGGSPPFDPDGEPWQGREVILSVFWRDDDGTILMREQVERLAMDQMVMETNDSGRPQRVITLERPDIIQRDIEGKTDNAEFQKQIDDADLGYQHTAATASQKIFFGRLDETAADATNQTRPRG